MPWLFFVLSVLCFVVAFRTQSIGLAALTLLGALAFLLAGVFSLASRRIAARARGGAEMISAEDLMRMREAAEARRAAAGAEVDPSEAGAGQPPAG
ncbi:MAG TPA: hypothetical protein VFG21_02745 [Xanthomonadaceae bacterium]|nr:hypothetical protein [Xanthomonadaceae bacterium]